MSRPMSIIIKCPNCGKEHEFQAWSSINVDLDPEMKEEILSRKIFTFKCPDCNTEHMVLYPLLYHDMDKHIMIQFCSEDENDSYIEQTEKSTQLINEQLGMSVDTLYTYRFVNDVVSLNEKINIFDAARNDRVIELMKAVVKNNIETEQPIERLVYLKEDNKEIFVVIGREEELGIWEIPDEMFEEFTNIYEAAIQNDNEKYIVDEKWAIHFLNELYV